MNKTELVAKVAEKSGLTKKDAEQALAAVVGAVTEALAANQKVQLIGFGTFEVKSRGERTGRNPSTGAAITIAASVCPVFKAGKALKETVAKSVKPAPAPKKEAPKAAPAPAPAPAPKAEKAPKAAKGGKKKKK